MSYRITVPRKATTSLDFDGSHFIVHAPFTKDSWINQLAAGSWDKKQGFWKLPPYILYAKTVIEQLPDIAVSNEALNQLEMSELAAEPVGGGWDPRLRTIYQQLHFYQRQAVYRLVWEKPGCLLALSPGLGKTIVTLLAARLLGLQRVLIIAPRPLLRSWENEQMKWFGDVITSRRHGMPPTDWPRPDDVLGWVLTNYETVIGSGGLDDHKRPVHAHGHAAEYTKVDWDLVVLDESVLVKNRDSRRFKVLERMRKPLLKSGRRWWELSGSPVTKYYDDLWAQLHLIDPHAFSSYWRFTNRYCYVVQDVWGTQITGSRMNLDIRDDLKDVVFVRNQEEVLPDLPDEIPQLVEVEISGKQLKAYDEMANDFVTKLESGTEIKADIVLAQMTRLQQITSNLVNIGGEDISAKADALMEMVEARSFEFPAIVWTHWVPGARALYSRFGGSNRRRNDGLRVAWIRGAETEREEQDNEEKFEAYKAGNIDILILSIDVGKFGHNLQITRTAAYIDKTWDADAYVQSMKRIKRIGLDHRPMVLTFKDPRTVDQIVEDNLSGKLKGIATVTNSDLAAMLRHLRGG